jgi:hypothetical protein
METIQITTESGNEALVSTTSTADHGDVSVFSFSFRAASLKFPTIGRIISERLLRARRTTTPPQRRIIRSEQTSNQSIYRI